MRIRQKHSGVWEVTVEGRPDAVTGRRQQISRCRWPDGRPCSSKTDAKKRGELLQQELDENFGQPVSNDTVGSWLTRWLEDEVRPHFALNTYKGYEGNVRLRVPDAFKRLKLRDVTPAHAAGLVKFWREQGLSQHRQHACWATMSASFNDALALGLISKSPFHSGVNHAMLAKRRPTVWKSDQIAQFLAACRESQERIDKLFIVQAATGARLGSLLTAQEADYDKACRRLLLWDGKNDASKREVPLTQEAVAAIEACLEQQAQARAGWKPERIFRESWLFRSPRGRQITHSMAEHRFQALREELGLPYSRPHDLRHYVASSALSAGVDIKLVSVLLGHSSTAVTREIYQHVLDDRLIRQTAELVADQTRKASVV